MIPVACLLGNTLDEGMITSCNLDLESKARTTTTSSLELTTLRTHVGTSLATRSSGSSEVLHSLASIAVSLEQNSVRTSGSTQSELVQSDALASSLHDASTSCLSEVQSAHLQSRNIAHTDVVGNCANHHSNLVLLSLHVSDQAAQIHRRAVNAAHVKASQNHLRELSIRATSKETIQLRITQFHKTQYIHQQSQVHVLALRSLSSLVSTVTTSSNKINTLQRG